MLYFCVYGSSCLLIYAFTCVSILIFFEDHNLECLSQLMCNSTNPDILYLSFAVQNLISFFYFRVFVIFVQKVLGFFHGRLMKKATQEFSSSPIPSNGSEGLFSPIIGEELDSQHIYNSPIKADA